MVMGADFGSFVAMLVDRYPAMNLFVLAPDLAIGFDPVLRELDRLLEDSAILKQSRPTWRGAHAGV
jgi:hypothetical protein